LPSLLSFYLIHSLSLWSAVIDAVAATWPTGSHSRGHPHIIITNERPLLDLDPEGTHGILDRRNIIILCVRIGVTRADSRLKTRTLSPCMPPLRLRCARPRFCWRWVRYTVFVWGAYSFFFTYLSHRKPFIKNWYFRFLPRKRDRNATNRMGTDR